MFTLNPDRWREISPYLDEILSLPEQERAKWFDSFRRQRPDLAELIQELLNEQSALAKERFLERAPVTPVSEASLVGRIVGAYKLVSPIGQGGMGSVWLAERSDGRFERQVAVKFLNFAVAAQGAERFKREGSILGRLAHPHIAELMDAGVTANGEPYLVLEHVEGEPIDEYCDRSSLDVNARVRLFLDVLSAVAQAHANLVVHRDIKPSNVLVRSDGCLKLLDFGIAKLLSDDAKSAAATLLTVEGGGALTPQFAAPEQITGGAITTATDVYALGVLLYLLLTGRHPAGPPTQSTAALVKAILDTEPRRASEAVDSEDAAAAATKRATMPDKLRRQLCGDLDTIVAKALKKNPAERYSSVSALADDLQRTLRHEPIAARPDTFAYRAAKFVRRNRVTVSLAALALMAVIAGITGTLIQARTARKERDFALRQVDRADAINDFNEFLLSDAAPSGKPFTVNELLDRAEHILSRQHGPDDNRVELLASIGLQYSIQEEDSKARQILEEAYKLSRTTREPSIRAAVSCALASALTRDGELERAEAMFQEGWRALPDEPLFAYDRVQCLRSGSEVAQERGDVREGVGRMEAAQQILKQSPFDSDWSEMLTLMDLGEAYRVAGQNYQASLVFERVNTLVSSLGRDETQSAGVLFNDWALALEKLGRPMEAQALFRRAIDIHREGQTEETVPPVILNNYAITLRSLGRLLEASDYAARAYKKAEQEGDQFAIYRSLNVRGAIYLDQRDFNGAERMLADLEPILRKKFSPNDMWFGILASAQGLLASGKGDAPGALLLSDQAVQLIESAIRAGGQGSDQLPIVLLRRATVELQAGRALQAAADAARAVTLLRSADPPGAFSCHIGRAYLVLGQALQAQHKNDEARAAFRAGAEHLEKSLGTGDPESRAARQLASLDPH